MIRTIIIEDEPVSRDLLTLMLGRFKKDIDIIDTCSNPTDGIRSIETHKPDLIFLDIQMPVMTGFEMLKQVKNIDFDIIFTTAYNHYAIHAIRICALDYLLKPIDHDELSAAIDNFKNKSSNVNSYEKFQFLLENIANKNPLNKTIALSAIDGISFIKMIDVLWVEANGRYTKFHLINKETVTVSKTLGEYEEILVENQFVRIHDSAIINLNHVKKYIRGNGGTVVLSDKTELDVSRRRKDDFIKLIPKL